MSDLLVPAPVGRPAEHSADQFFGLMRMGGALLALPVPAIREVIPGQATYSVLPAKAEGLKGAFEIRGSIIPFLDLRHTLGLSAEGDDEHVIVIMRWQGYLVGLRAREVCGIARLHAGDLFTLATRGPKSGVMLATHTFQSGDEIATVLDPRSIAELPDVPMVEEKIARKASGHTTAAESILLFTYGRSHFGIEATCVEATLPAVRVERNALAGGACLGVIDHHGFEVPVVDTTAAIGLGAGMPLPETPVVVIRFSTDAMLGFAVDAVSDIARIVRSDILPMPSLPLGEAPLFSGMIVGQDGRQSLLIDAANLRARPMLQTLARMRKPRLALQKGAAAASAGPVASARSQPFLTYVAGAQHATPLEQITEILAYPADVAPFDLSGPGVLGLFTHRGRVAPLICLGTLLGRPGRPDPATARVLFVEDAGRPVGFVVEALHSIEAVSWYSPAPAKGASERGLFNSLVMLGSGSERRMVSHLDLIAHGANLYDSTGSIRAVRRAG